MEPKIHKGDAVIIDKKFEFDNLEEGQVIAYKTSDIIVVHRIIKKAKVKDSYYYVTKGDANKNDDNLIIEEKMIVGIVDHKLPYVGLPKVWLSGL